MEPKLVTDNQGLHLAKLGRQKKVTQKQFQQALPKLREVLDAIRDGLPINVGRLLTPPPGGRIHTVKVAVDYGEDWQEAVNTAGPNTPGTYNIRKVGDFYPGRKGRGRREKELILVNFGSAGTSWDEALRWGQSMGLVKTEPREVFAVGKTFHTLHRELGINPMYVVSTEDCVFDGARQACYVWWYDSVREAYLSRLPGFGGAHGWFAFARK